MKLKVNLHFHTREDPRHSHQITYTLKEGVDRAASYDFDVIALTCHKGVVMNPHFKKYAASKNILLLSGVELYIKEKSNMQAKHLVVLNCDQSIENVETFADLEEYKKKHPEIFVLAPHPYFYGNYSLKKYLEKYIHLIDAIEHSWFYSKMFNRNIKAKQVAQKYNLPFIATSDTHFFNFLNTDYAIIDAGEKTPAAIFNAIKNNRFKNITSPKSFLRDMVLTQGSFEIKDKLQKYKNKKI